MLWVVITLMTIAVNAQERLKKKIENKCNKKFLYIYNHNEKSCVLYIKKKMILKKKFIILKFNNLV